MHCSFKAAQRPSAVSLLLLLAMFLWRDPGGTIVPVMENFFRGLPIANRAKTQEIIIEKAEHQLHLLNPQLHTKQPASFLIRKPQSGQMFPLVAVGNEASPKASSIALAIASGQESTFTLSPFFLAVAVERQRMPRSCSMSSFGSTPDRRAVETALQVASD